jgi:hypothetical protein
MFYAAKCYWPGVSETEFEATAARATANSSRDGRHGATYLGSLLFRDDELVLCMFEAPSPSAVKRASDRAGIPCERVMDSVWLEPRPDNETEREQHRPWQAWGSARRGRTKADS